MTAALETDQAIPRARIEEYIRELLERSRADGLRGALTAAAVRRIVVRDLGEMLMACEGDE